MIPTIRPALPDPPFAADEKTTLSGFLDWYRDVIVRKVEGLRKEDATRRLVPSATTLLGLVKHLARVERYWFQIAFMGEPDNPPLDPDDPDADFRIEREESVGDVIASYQREVGRSRQIVAGANLDDRARRPDRATHTLRWIMVHMVDETARHAGHADILREQTDGATGE